MTTSQPHPRMGFLSGKACHREDATDCCISITHPNPLASALPAGTSQVSDLHVEEGQKGVSTERTGCVQVGIVSRPAGHDFLIVHQAVTCLAAGTAGDQQLKKDRRWNK